MKAEPFSVLVFRGDITPLGSEMRDVSVARAYFIKLMRNVLSRVDVDEEWYLSRYADVRKALEAGIITSARDHYMQDGYYESRYPFEIKVDEKWYLEQYQDVASAVRAKSFKSAQDHFDRIGFKEGRLPYVGFTLENGRTRSDLAALDIGDLGAAVAAPEDASGTNAGRLK